MANRHGKKLLLNLWKQNACLVTELKAKNGSLDQNSTHSLNIFSVRSQKPGRNVRGKSKFM